MPNKFLRLANYVLCFGLGRGALFGAPLLLANILPAIAYGQLEAAMAAASVVTTVAALGSASGVPLVLLGRNSDASMKGIVSHHLLIVALCTCALLLGFGLDWPQAYVLPALFAAGIALQALASVHLKTQGRGDASVLIDAGLLGLMACAAVLARFSHLKSPESWVWSAAGIYVAMLTVAYIRYLAHPERVQERLSWRSTMAMGVPLMLGGVVSLLATTSGRLGMGLLAQPEMTAEYAVLARAAALPVVAHQLILVAKFRSIFAQEDDVVARMTLQIILLVAASVVGFIWISPWLGFLFGDVFVRAFLVHRDASCWLAAQAILWSAIALNDLVIARHQAMSKILPYSISFLALFLFFGWTVLHIFGLSVDLFIFTHGFVMLLFYCVQSLIMYRLGFKLQLTWIFAIIIYITIIAMNFIPLN